MDFNLNWVFDKSSVSLQEILFNKLISSFFHLSADCSLFIMPLHVPK